MVKGALSIKLRCASWQQLATIYRRDLSHGTMFLKAVTPPAVGTAVRIDLALPSATVIVLTGVVQGHVSDPKRGAGVELTLAPIPTGSVWLIESALASEHKRLAAPVHDLPTPGPHPTTGIPPTVPPASPMIPIIPMMIDSADVTLAEQDLIKALVSEAESLRKLSPFLVLGVGYEATDGEVRAAFGELTKRYHPDRFARYESAELRQVAAEIFILIRDAYRRLGDAAARAQLLQALGKPASAPRPVPGPPRSLSTRRAASDPGSLPHPATRPSAPSQPPQATEPIDVSPIEDLLDQGRLEDALAAYRAMAKKYPHDRNLRAGVELCEGLRARDRLEAAQRFEAALEIDPSNERAARELAGMRRQATHERKGLLSRLMKKEP